MPQQPVESVLASFPRSGRTWLAGMISAVQLRDLRRQGLSGLRAFVNTLDGDSLVRWADCFGEHPRPPLRLATHDDYHQRKHAQADLILLCREPADALLSYFHYQQSHQGTFSGSIDDFLDRPGLGIKRLAKWYNSWAPCRERATVITYEALRTDTETQLGRALDAFGIEFDVDLGVIADRWDFDKRQQNERERSPRDDSSGLFIRAGAIGEGMSTFTPEQLASIKDGLASHLSSGARDMMHDLGYELAG